MQNKRSKKELTRLILTALILGSGSLYGPVAEALDYLIDENPSSYQYSGMLTVDLEAKWACAKGENTWTLNFNSGNTAWSEYTAYGAYKEYGGGGQFTLQNGTIANAYGMYQSSGGAYNGRVIIRGGAVTGAVYGGYSGLSSASNNIVTISGTPTLSSAVIYGAYAASTASNNIININSEVTVKGIKGGEGSTSTGNTLNLGATGIKVGAEGIRGTQTIAITSGVGFDTSKTVLEMTGDLHNVSDIKYVDYLDLTNATGLTNTGKTGYATTVDTMTLVEDTHASIGITNWKYGESTGALTGSTAFATNTGQEYTPSGGNGAKLIYTNTHTVKFRNTNKYQIDYTVADTVTGVNLADWDSTKAAFAVPTGWTKSSSAISVTGTFTTPSLAAGTPKDIVTAGANFFNNVSIADAIKYKDVDDFTNDTANGVTLSGDIYRGVKVTDDGTIANAKLTYFADTKRPTSIVLGDMTWGTGRAMSTGYDFSGVTSININTTGLNFSNPTAVTGSMTLLSNATGLTAGSSTSHSQTFSTDADNGAALTATLSGNVTRGTSAVGYTYSGTSLKSVDLTNWDATKNAYSVPTGWTKKDGGISVTAGSGFAPTLEEGTTYKNILTADTDLFSDADIPTAIKYKESGDIVDIPTNGVTFTGKTAGGVTATNSGKNLTYFAQKNDVTGITLGTMEWNTPRTAGSTYDFSGVKTINASNLTFTGKATAADATMNLVTGATGLDSATITSLTQPGAGKGTVAAEFTDTNGIAYTGIGTGTVSVPASSTNVQFKITGGTVSGINLNGWNGTKATALADGWSGTGMAVDTGSFSTEGLTDGAIIFDLTETSNTFGDVTGARAYKDNDPVNDDTANGVTLAGVKSGGVQKSTDSKKLTYSTESMNVNKITLGNMKWRTGRAITGTGYNFANVGNNDVDATGLSFTFTGDEANTIANGDDWDLLTGASGLASGLAVKGSPVSQKISYGISNVADLAGTLTGKVTTATNAVHYAVTGKTLDRVDISKWNGETTDTAVNASWSKNPSGIAVTGSGFKTPTVVGEYNILTAGSTGFFTGANIDSSIAYQPSGTYSETAQNITLSGQQAKGVLVVSNGTSLQYKLGEAYIDTIQLGNVAYSKDAVLLDKSSAMYNFSKVTGLDKSGFSMTMTDAQKKTAKAADSMTLVKANGTLNNIAAQETGKSSYSYTAAAGLTVKGALTGSVAATAGNVLYTVDSNKASDLTVSTVGWNSTYARPDSEIAYSDAIVNAENVTFSGVSTLNKGDTMTLVSNFGTSVNRAKGGIFTLDNGKTGKGHAYWDSATQSLVYVVDRGADETVETKNAIGNKTTVDGENPHQGDVSGGEAEGDGESRGNETTVKNSHIQKNDDGTGGDANGGTSEDGDADKNKLTVEESEVDGDANGGQSDTGNTDDNETIIKKSIIHGGVAGGETLGGPGGSKRNKTTVEESTVEGDVDGGKTGGDGDADENEVILKGSKVGGDVNGGHSGKGNAGGNKTEVDDSTVEGDVNGGKTDGDGDTKKNEVIVKGSKIGGDVNGGHSGGNGESSGNEADVDGSTVDGDVNGGKSDGNGDSKNNKANVKNGSKIGGNVTGGNSGGSGESSGNEADVDGSEVGGDVTGGKSEKGNADKNEAKVTGGSKVSGNVIGGKSNGSGTASENKATVTGSEVGGNVVGGQSESGNTNQNDVRVTAGSKITGSVIGGQSNGSGTSSANKANVEGSTVGGNIIGGYSKEGTVSSNEAAVNGGSVAGSVFGGKTDGSNAAASNAVTLDGGAEIKGAVYGGYSENGTADGNIVTVNKAAINDDYVYGGKSKLRSSNDLVYFNDGTVLGIIGGGCSEAVSNSVSLLKGGVTEHVIGGFASDTATNNTVNITGGTVNGSVIGGYGGTAAANENTVNLGGGTVKGNNITSATLGVTIAGGVYGGYSTSGTTRNNTVNLYGTADISATSLFGGNQEATGNDLYVGMLLADATQSSWTGGSQCVQNIANFETINFAVVPWNKNQPALTITDGTASDLSKATVIAKNVAFTGVKTLSVNDSMTLLDQSKAAKPATSITEASDFTIGVAVEGTGALSRDGAGNVLYKVKSVRASEQTHNTLMGAEAAVTAINVGNDFIGAATEGLSLDENIGSDGVGCFAKIGGGHMQQETGSHVNVNTWNAILALGHKNVQKKSTVEYGAFFEYGRGNYATYNDNGQRGDGSVHYTGGGLLGKWTKDNGLYVEGSFRAGTVDEDARNLLRDTARAYSYNTSTNYMGFHIGVGKQIAVANGGVVDVYGKYFYNRKSGVNFTAAGADYNLDSVTSQIIRLGARYTMKREKWNYYVDAAYEHELDGKASGRVNNLAIRGADTSGGSFRMELGATLLPQKDSPWNLNLNLTGYAGKKQGIQGGVTVKYLF